MRVGIIGGGIIGCAIARALSKRGADVTLFEPRTIGGGATHASAGALVPYVEAHDRSPLLSLSIRSLALYDAFIHEVQEESGIPIDYARCGSLEIALSSSDEEHLRQTVARHPDASMQWVSRNDLGSWVPGLSADAVGGVLVEGHGYVSAAQLTHALAAASRRSGATIVPRSAVNVQCVRGGAVVVCDRDDTFAFDRVVIANGAWASTLRVADTATSIPVRPVKGQLLRVRPPVPLARLVWSSVAYFVPQASGEVIVGATMEEVGFDERTTVEGVSALVAAACRVFPGWSASEFLQVRAGLRPASPDNLPLIGPARACPSVTFAVGHFRNGVILAPLTADLVADLIFGGPEDPVLAVLSPARFGL